MGLEEHKCPYPDCKYKNVVFATLELKAKHIYLAHIKPNKKKK